MEDQKGLIFNIQKYCVHDGPGIRSVVFFKGCPLACKWCSNPEGMSLQPEISYKSKKCLGKEVCGYCLKVCPNQAITENVSGYIQIDHQKCRNCTECANVCPSKAIEKMGKWMSVSEVLQEVVSDSAFYSRSGGGITISGGEPLLQSDFAVALLKAAKEEGLMTAIETTGCVAWDQARPVFKELDVIHMDIKMVDNKKHRFYTGRDNDLILDNFRKLCREFPEKKIIVRTPVIPGVNDSIEDIQKISDFINESAVNRENVFYELLPFHNFGSSKYEFQGKEYCFKDYKNMEKDFVRNIRLQVRSNIKLLEIR